MLLELFGRLRDAGEVRRDLLRGSSLLFADGTRRLDGLRDALDGLVHLVQGRLNFLRCLAGLLGEFADFLCDDGEAAALLTSTGSLDGRVEAEEVRSSGPRCS